MLPIVLATPNTDGVDVADADILPDSVPKLANPAPNKVVEPPHPGKLGFAGDSGIFAARWLCTLAEFNCNVTCAVCAPNPSLSNSDDPFAVTVNPARATLNMPN